MVHVSGRDQIKYKIELLRALDLRTACEIIYRGVKLGRRTPKGVEKPLYRLIHSLLASPACPIKHYDFRTKQANCAKYFMPYPHHFSTVYLCNSTFVAAQLHASNIGTYVVAISADLLAGDPGGAVGAGSASEQPMYLNRNRIHFSQLLAALFRLEEY